jgi:hypothetical protein
MSPITWALLLFAAIGAGIGVAIMIESKRRFGTWIP